jgi:hypothetical protein
MKNILADLKVNPNRRFKRILIQIDHKRVERYYVDDGSVEGLLILTIIPDDVTTPTMNEIGNYSTKFTLGFKYL